MKNPIAIQLRRSAAVVLVAAAVISLLAVKASPPAWWASRGVLTTNSTSDFAVANAGQLKFFARMAYDELQTNLIGRGGAGAPVSNMVFGFLNTNNYATINLGQLKYVATPIYDCLISNSILTNYPWTASTSDDADFLAANIGQLKTVFTFTLDADDDGLPDWWEYDYFGHTGVSTNADPDLDAYNNLQEYWANTNPNQSNPPPSIAITYPVNGGTLP